MLIYHLNHNGHKTGECHILLSYHIVWRSSMKIVFLLAEHVDLQDAIFMDESFQDYS